MLLGIALRAIGEGPDRWPALSISKTPRLAHLEAPSVTDLRITQAGYFASLAPRLFTFGPGGGTHDA